MRWKGSGVSWRDAPDMEIIYSSVTLGTCVVSLPLLCVLLIVFVLYIVHCSLLAHT